MINETLTALSNDKQTNDISWRDILKLLNMTSGTFRDDAEMTEGYKFMVQQIEAHGRAWVREHRGYVISQWEQHKQEYREQIRKEQKKRKQRKDKRKGLLKQFIL